MALPKHYVGGASSTGGKRLFTSLFTVLFLFSFSFVSADTPISSEPLSFNVFLVVAGISVFLLFVGLGAGIPFFTIVGFFLVAVLGFVIQAGNLYVPTGDVTETYVYSVNDTVDSVVSEKGFELWNNGNYHFIGFFLMFIGIIASFFSVFATFGGGGY